MNVIKECGGSIKYGNIFCKNSKAIKEKTLCETILNDLSNLFDELNKNQLDDVLRKQIDNKRKLLAKEISTLETTIRKFTKKIQYYDLFLEKEISKEELEELREMFKLKVNKHKNEILNITSQIEEIAHEDHLHNLKDKLNECTKRAYSKYTPYFCKEN
ncbi:hypothetical protein [Gottfriedia acidiceleris]|uniref:hypothetical protein n=1 Tax=Gottfriedia acidiceleris TaxID=371036 RepID=UPI000B42EC3F|nr:hypothetical protein [Gottfriedia acidiceleris]